MVCLHLHVQISCLPQLAMHVGSMCRSIQPLRIPRSSLCRVGGGIIQLYSVGGPRPGKIQGMAVAPVQLNQGLLKQIQLTLVQPNLLCRWRPTENTTAAGGDTPANLARDSIEAACEGLPAVAVPSPSPPFTEPSQGTGEQGEVAIIDRSASLGRGDEVLSPVAQAMRSLA
ncbi:hypothetical protein B296_00020087 [Ensete ventricosum]|uniref:Uncharacterized protein n=1 Tax=Ensete ventricosum TaxID=4639 RepID=A0A427A6V8_ENSVE|nr:hypothetical protein B296_00020087 [Ensete ventricosum]